MWNLRPSVDEVNKYTGPVVDRLLFELNKVTHPEFDEKLRQETGIGWKQIKNYRNHTEPTSTIPQNSKVLKFVYESRKKDRGYRLRQNLALLASVILIAATLSMIIWSVQQDQVHRETQLNALIEQRIREAYSQSPFQGCSRQAGRIKCPEGVYSLESSGF